MSETNQDVWEETNERNERRAAEQLRGWSRRLEALGFELCDEAPARWIWTREANARCLFGTTIWVTPVGASARRRCSPRRSTSM